MFIIVSVAPGADLTGWAGGGISNGIGEIGVVGEIVEVGDEEQKPESGVDGRVLLGRQGDEGGELEDVDQERLHESESGDESKDQLMAVGARSSTADNNAGGKRGTGLS